MVAGIREIGDNHIVILEAAQWDLMSSVLSLIDGSCIPEFHTYMTAMAETESGENRNEWNSEL
jgi:hypothetical protein